jgi:signal transduction histidine kinase
MPTEKLNGIRARRSGVGIAGMRERVRYFKGVMNIRSNDTGTRISVTLPVSTTNPSDGGGILQQQRLRIAG